MKTLYIIRHAKSSWDDSDQSDFERPLNKRGTDDAPIMARRLKNRSSKPELIISSPAVRAFATAKIFAGELEYPYDKIVTEEKIYEAGIRELISVVNRIDDEVQSALLFGHNPGLTSLSNFLGDTPVPEMPTCSVVGLRFNNVKWAEIERYSGKFFLFDYPKNSDN